MKAFEDATGEPLPEDKKELATEELITTGDLGDDIGQDKATRVINDIKTEIIKNGTKDTIQIAETINNVTNNYNITLSSEQQKQIEDLMKKIADQNYDYNKINETLNNVSDIVDKNLSDMGESRNNKGFFDTIKGWFSGIGEWFGNLFGQSKDLGILENTNDELLGNNAQIDATDKSAINLPSSEQVEGFFAKIWNWFTGLFSNNNNSNNTENNGDSSYDNNSSKNDAENTNIEGSSDISEEQQNEQNGENSNSEDSSSVNEEQSQDQPTENNTEVPSNQ